MSLFQNRKNLLREVSKEVPTAVMMYIFSFFKLGYITLEGFIQFIQFVFKIEIGIFKVCTIICNSFINFASQFNVDTFDELIVALYKELRLRLRTSKNSFNWFLMNFSYL